MLKGPVIIKPPYSCRQAGHSHNVRDFSLRHRCPLPEPMGSFHYAHFSRAKPVKASSLTDDHREKSSVSRET